MQIVELKTKEVRKLIGSQVWIMYRDDWGRYRKVTIYDVVRKNIDIGNDWKHFGQISHIRTDDPDN